jgi:hypothetical protein
MVRESWGGAVQDRSVEGVAALTLLESLIVTLRAHGLLEEMEVDEIFETAIAAQRDAAATESDGAWRQGVADLLERLHVEGNAVLDRRSEWS